MSKNNIESERPLMTIRRMCACEWHAGYLRLQTHTRYIIFIAFPRQQ